MGIQLSNHDKHMINQVAVIKDMGIPIHPLVFGYLSSAVEPVLKGLLKMDRLAEVYALCELLIQLYDKYSVQELMEIACGTRELPGEDVQSVQ